jgi:hypothetical protein
VRQEITPIQPVQLNDTILPQEQKVALALLAYLAVKPGTKCIDIAKSCRGTRQ